jgi:hypothetical protein
VRVVYWQPDRFFQDGRVADIDSEYRRLVNIRLLLRIEEIITELLNGEEAVVFQPSKPYRQKLVDMRMLIGVACRTITLFEEHCVECGVHLEFADIGHQTLMKSRAFKLMEPYLDKSVGLEEFADFRDYHDVCLQDYHIVCNDDDDDDGDEYWDSWYERNRSRLEYTPLQDELLEDSSNSNSS